MQRLALVLLSLVFFIGCATLDHSLAKGWEYEKQGEYILAAHQYEGLLTTKPNEPKILYNTAIAYAKAAEYESALTYLRQLNVITHNSNLYYLQALGGVAAAADKIDEAIAAWELAIALDPLDKQSRAFLWDALQQLQRYEEAYEIALEAYKLKQYSKELLQLLGELHMRIEGKDSSDWALLAQEL